MRNHDRRSGFDSLRAEPFQSLRDLTDEELLDRCEAHGIRVAIPYSQLESEAVLRGVSLAAILRAYLIQKLQEADEA